MGKFIKGTYVLLLSLDREAVVPVGRLGVFIFPAGYYVYAGSALGGLLPRVERHIRGGKRLHWHIDYLRRSARVVEVWYLVSTERLECDWYRAAAGMRGASVPVNGFGSSGCRCHSHLVHFKSKPSFEDFRSRIGGWGADLERTVCEGDGSPATLLSLAD